MQILCLTLSFQGGQGGDKTDTPLFFSARPLGRVGDLSIFLEDLKAVRKCSKAYLCSKTFEVALRHKIENWTCM